MQLHPLRQTGHRAAVADAGAAFGSRSPVREPGNLKEADAWFEAPPREVDGFLNQEMVQHLEIWQRFVSLKPTPPGTKCGWRRGSMAICARSESASSSCISRDWLWADGA